MSSKPLPPDTGAAACAAVIGGGPAGLMAAEVLSEAGLAVELFDAMPSVGRKFLLAGIGGLNLTHSEPLPQFLGRYGDREADVAGWLADFPPDALRDWAGRLGIATFVGSSGRVFPTDMKAAPLLRAWLHRLRGRGVRFHMRQRWLGWSTEAASDRPPGLRFATPAGESIVTADAVVLALGGASWPRLGSDGAWLPALQARGVEVAPLRPANCGFDVGRQAGDGNAVVVGWSELFRQRAAGQPIKTVAMRCAAVGDREPWQRGEFVFTETGIEGSLVYALSAPLRDAIERHGGAVVELDLLPDHDAQRVRAEVARPRGSRSLSSHLKSRLKLDALKTLLLHELLPKETFNDPAALAAAIKALPLRLLATRPIAEAISTAGGVRLEAVDRQLMLHRLPGVFCAGEMLDWEAPTGGYLLTAAIASGRRAGQGAERWLRSRQ
ncbi:TIGR03862 family flavoprotein [Piscinibacter sakaiensis]|uniref:TIGR03862 family flavoprotein n=1 Tax=Piscinibacter sakaiensis TaxID=1547922 RepID=UPI003AB0B6A2